MKWACIDAYHRSPQEKIFQILEDIAIASGEHSKLAAAVVHRKEIISIGVNMMKTHPLQNRFSKNEHAVFFHAEVNAISKALKVVDESFLKKCDLYVLRMKRDEQKEWIRALAKPCSGCMKAIHHYQFNSVFYTL